MRAKHGLGSFRIPTNDFSKKLDLTINSINYQENRPPYESGVKNEILWIASLILDNL